MKRAAAVGLTAFAALAVSAAPASAVEGATGQCAGLIGIAEIPVEQGPYDLMCAADSYDVGRRVLMFGTTSVGD